MDLLKDLNETQSAAVQYNEGPELVIAGAGSGKTRVLTYKIAYLLSQGIPAYQILALTFTNKAAREMKERIGKLVPPETARYLWMGTFHSICNRILRQEASKTGFTKDFTIYDTSDSKSLIKQICKEQQLDEKIYKPNTVLSKISAAKNALITTEAYALNNEISKQDRYDRMYNMADVYRIYQQRLKSANAMDFDDLLVNLYQLLSTDKETLQHYQSIFQYILVDEYQDTNYVQSMLIKQLAAPENRLCVVGDDAQSIYSFRGADIRNILSFQKTYPNAKLFKLERNYRSTKTIVNAANSLIHKNQHQIYKEVYSEKEQGDKLHLTTYISDRDEASGIARGIRQIKRNRAQLNMNQIAVLYRTNAQSRVIENELRKYDIPYRIYGGMSFYQRKEIKDAISYFRLAINNNDNEALIRIINFPARGIGDTTLRKISEASERYSTNMLDVVRRPEAYGLEVNRGTLSRLIHFAELIDDFSEKADSMDAYQYADMVMSRSGISSLNNSRQQEDIDRYENLQELLNGIHEFVQMRQEQGIDFTPIHDFLNEVSLLTDQDENLQDQTPRVTLMTVHAAKGLEFPIVFIAGMEEDLFPSQFCTTPSEIEEERRLLYVAITRAMEQCHISFAKQRFKNGSITFSSPSRFLNDISRGYMDIYQDMSPQARNLWETRNTYTATYTTKKDIPNNNPSPKLKPITTAAASTTQDSEYKTGDRVEHRVFGKGTVLRVFTENDNNKIDIEFDTQGKKTLLLTYAKLTKTI